MVWEAGDGVWFDSDTTDVSGREAETVRWQRCSHRSMAGFKDQTTPGDRRRNDASAYGLGGSGVPMHLDSN
jgi:hypothetical protein